MSVSTRVLHDCVDTLGLSIQFAVLGRNQGFGSVEHHSCPLAWILALLRGRSAGSSVTVQTFVLMCAEWLAVTVTLVNQLCYQVETTWVLVLRLMVTFTKRRTLAPTLCRGSLLVTVQLLLLTQGCS